MVGGVAGGAGRSAAAVGVALALVAGSARAELPLEEIGRVEVLEAPLSPHVVWASDALLRRIALVDLESGRMLGVVDGGYGITAALFARSRPELYVPETHYSRGSRGERTDVVTLYDALALAPVAEVEIPGKRAINPLPRGNAALSDDDRFVAVFNQTPATSISIVDVERRRFTAEIATPGCSLVYAAGDRRFAMLCMDGALLLVELDEEGREAGRLRSEPFFDPIADPVTEKAVRRGDTWLFVSFGGWLHAVDLSGAEPRFAEPWSLLSEADREDRWRVGGRQHLAVHEGTGRLFSLVHQGGPDTHKSPGTELWVHDLDAQRRVRRIALRNPGLTYLGVPIGQGWPWPLHRIQDWIMGWVPELGVGGVTVTQDDEPLLVTGSDFSGSLAVYDALSGEFLRRVAVGNTTTLVLQVPTGTVEATR